VSGSRDTGANYKYATVANAGFNLPTAPAVTGSFTNLPAATSPYTNVTTSAQQFFRLNAD